ncbi:MAG: hypothetical protein JSC188_000860 [Candidatus Tokpelaia sp. JSC188]|nr:MAG: hypothetical protein JSC188_000860 [Candidatus Tokpelaia sp. JSC188]
MVNISKGGLRINVYPKQKGEWALNNESACLAFFETKTRHYTIILQKDLFNQWILVRIWGGKASRLGQETTTLCANYADGLILFKKTRTQRLRRKYIEVNHKTAEPIRSISNSACLSSIQKKFKKSGKKQFRDQYTVDFFSGKTEIEIDKNINEK